MHEIPNTMAEVNALVAKAAANGTPTDETTVITTGLQNWIQELLDEGFEGGYLTARFSPAGLVITGITGAVTYADASFTSPAWVTRFQTDPHGTQMALQTHLRRLIDAHQITF
ncbi:hypothetical protein [Lacticaseibacillus daqingensis]|uniref:hypothetical protein n=1 Tax=Lacticaseibacillus daqingensis TaxID=2486014 RepID=UPI000F7A9360|nr:hypothetical protein [Lacticaseibacillus daqingensis]